MHQQFFFILGILALTRRFETPCDAVSKPREKPLRSGFPAAIRNAGKARVAWT